MRNHRDALRIGIIGANSQVASEVILHAVAAQQFHVVGFVRSEYSAPMLKLLNRECYLIDFDSVSYQTRAALESCDMVVDFTYPAVATENILPTIRRNVASIIDCLRPGTKYVFISSISAYGMPAHASSIRNYAIPRSTYAFIKRRAERYVLKCASVKRVLAYLFRLGQVHGNLQGVSSHYREQAETGHIRTNGCATALCNVVFPHSIHDALLSCARGELQPAATYTLVCLPQWNLQKLLQYYAARYDYNFTIEYSGNSKGELGQYVRRTVRNFATTSRGVMEPVVMTVWPSLMPKIKARYRRSASRAPMGSWRQEQQALLRNLTGPVPTRLILGPSSGIEETLAWQRTTQSIWAAILEKGMS